MNLLKEASEYHKYIAERKPQINNEAIQTANKQHCNLRFVEEAIMQKSEISY